jgi:chromosome segregation ATPase
MNFEIQELHSAEQSLERARKAEMETQNQLKDLQDFSKKQVQDLRESLEISEMRGNDATERLEKTQEELENTKKEVQSLEQLNRAKTQSYDDVIRSLGEANTLAEAQQDDIERLQKEVADVGALR